MIEENTLREISRENGITSLRVLIGEYRFFIDEVHPDSREIRIKLFVDPTGGEYRFGYETDCEVRNPLFDDCDHSARTEEMALEAAIDSILCPVRQLIADGHSPDPTWFTPNEDF